MAYPGKLLRWMEEEMSRVAQELGTGDFRTEDVRPNKLISEPAEESQVKVADRVGGPEAGSPEADGWRADVRKTEDLAKRIAELRACAETIAVAKLRRDQISAEMLTLEESMKEETSRLRDERLYLKDLRAGYDLSRNPTLHSKPDTNLKSKYPNL